MLQKTLLNIEGLGRQLDPDLDLWVTAKPYLERWMSEQIGWRALVKQVREEAPFWATTLPQLPPTAGRVVLDGAELTKLSPTKRARRGLGRTFQRLEPAVGETTGHEHTGHWLSAPCS